MTTSDSQECYAYITLPGETTPITAGRLTVTLDRQGHPVGRFVYGKRYLTLDNAVEIDPVELLLNQQVHTTARLKGIFGALRDSSPDYWGRRIIERHCGKPTLNEIDYLIYAPDDHAGAISFGLNKTPPTPNYKFNTTLDLEQLQEAADAVIHEENSAIAITDPQIDDLLLLGTSMGGARPKATIEDNNGLWLAKFNRYDDRWNQARIEHAMLLLARKCGILTADSKVIDIGGKDVLLVKRFDREKSAAGYLRSRMVSGLTILKAEETNTSRNKWSYLQLTEELRRISAEPQHDAKEIFARMCFNALISNTDDHPRNHAILAKGNSWRLSPAYDLTPTVPISIEHRDLAMICGAHGRYANKNNLLSEHARFLLDKDQSQNRLEDIEKTIKSQWYTTARSVGVSEADCQKIATAFAYPGFYTE